MAIDKEKEKKEQEALRRSCSACGAVSTGYACHGCGEQLVK